MLNKSVDLRFYHFWLFPYDKCCVGFFFPLLLPSSAYLAPFSISSVDMHIERVQKWHAKENDEKKNWNLKCIRIVCRMKTRWHQNFHPKTSEMEWSKRKNHIANIEYIRKRLVHTKLLTAKGKMASGWHTGNQVEHSIMMILSMKMFLQKFHLFGLFSYIFFCVCPEEKERKRVSRNCGE